MLEQNDFKASLTREVRPTSEVELCLRMAHCSAAEAAAWLAGRPIDYSSVMGTPRTPAGSHLTEYILYRRRDPAIDLALAVHGRSRTVLSKLYARAGSSLRPVLAGNGSLFGGDTHGSRIPYRERDKSQNLLWDIVRGGSLGELRAVCSNSDISSGFYGALITAWKPNDSWVLSEERFRRVVEFLADNPRVSQSREESRERHYLDGFADYTYSKFYVGAWELAATVPVTPAWGHALANLYRHLHRPYDCLKNVEEVLARWTLKVEEGRTDPYRDLRARICAAFVKPTLDELRHDDPARRDAFLSTFDPEDRAFRDLDWNEFLTLDRYWDINVYGNMKVWASAAGRANYRQLLWASSKADSDITRLGFFDERKDELQKQHPEWFADDDCDDQPDAEPDKVDLLRAEIRDAIVAVRQRGKSHAYAAGLLALGLLIGAAL